MSSKIQRKTTRAVPILLAAVVFAVFSSCLDIAADLTIRDDGSGTMTLRYTVSRLVMDIGAYESGNAFLPIPIAEDDFRRSVQLVDGLTLQSFRSRSEGENVIVDAELGFRSIDALSAFLGRDARASLAAANNRTTFSFTFYTPPDEPYDEQTLAFARSYFADYSVRWTVRAPRNVASVSTGGTTNGSTAVFEFPLSDLLMRTDPVVIEAAW